MRSPLVYKLGCIELALVIRFCLGQHSLCELPVFQKKLLVFSCQLPQTPASDYDIMITSRKVNKTDVVYLEVHEVTSGL